MPKFVIEIKEVYIVKYRCEGESKEEIEEDYRNLMTFGIVHKLEPLQDPIEYVCDADENKLHRILTLAEYNKENEGAEQTDAINTYDPLEIAKEILDEEDDEFIIE